MRQTRVGELFVPSQILTEMREVDAGVNALAADMVTQDFANGRLAEEYQKFALEWREFYDEHRESWTKRALNLTRDLVRNYKTRLLGWREKFMEAGGRNTIPAPILPKGEGLFDKVSIGKLLIVGIGISGAIWFFSGKAND